MERNSGRDRRRQTPPLEWASCGEKNEAVTKVKLMLIEKARTAFIEATTAKKYKAALRLATRLRGKDQLVILDALFAAAKRLKVDKVTGDPLGMVQQLDGSVVVTWATTTKLPDGSE